MTQDTDNNTVPDISIVVPFYNEEENVERLHRVIKETLDATRFSYELIYVDDGSRDGTYPRMREISKGDATVVLVKLRNNFGQSAAMAAGFEQARGRVVITMDGDLQNDPADIPKVMAKLDEGWDVVSGWRKNRKDKLLMRKVPSRIANRIICNITGVHLHDTGCALKAYRGDILRRIRLYGELHRFIPVLARIEGARITEMVVNHHPRRFGQSKYNLTRTFKVIMDLTTLNLLLKYLRRPHRYFGVLGALLAAAGVALLGAAGWLVLGEGAPIENINVLISTTFLLLVAGFQFQFLGLIATLIVWTGSRRTP